MPKSYVVDGAKLDCKMGDSSSKLRVLPTRKERLTGKCQANISDCKPFVNVPPFGKCKSMVNPAVAAATAAAQGKLQPMPCTPTCVIWLGGKPDHWVEKVPALMVGDKAVCPLGAGMIQVMNSGQGGPKSAAGAQLPATGSSLIADSPEPGSLSNLEAREWYHKQLDDIPNRIDPSLSLEDQARQASELRNQIRTDTRIAMQDQDLAQQLFADRPNKPFEFFVEKYSAPDRSMDDVYNRIIEAS